MRKREMEEIQRVREKTCKTFKNRKKINNSFFSQITQFQKTKGDRDRYIHTQKEIERKEERERDRERERERKKEEKEREREMKYKLSIFNYM